MKRILYRVMEWGLGHATRNLPLIKRLAEEGHEVTVTTCGRTQVFLKMELKNKVEFIDFPQDLPNEWGRDCHWVFLLPKLPIILSAAIRSVEKEKMRFEELLSCRSFDVIISDNCYGSSSERIPSYFISHHLKIYWFIRSHSLQRLNERLAAQWINKFHRILVPDYEHHSLSGKLSRDFKYIEAKKVSYIGILSDLTQQGLEEDIDYFIPISGAEPQRTSFEKLILEQVRPLRGKIVIALGKPEELKGQKQIGDNITVYNVCSKTLRNELLNRAKVVIARFGYSTLMDLVELKKRKALLIPTPNHTEQEYLAWYHKKQKTFFSVNQRRLNLCRDVGKAQAFNGITITDNSSTRASVETFMNILTGDGVI